MIRSIPRSALITDIVIASVMFAVLTPLGFSTSANIWMLGIDSEALRGGALVMSALLQCAGVAVLRLSPGIALTLAWAGAIVQMLGGLAPLPSNIAILFVLFATAAWGSLQVFWLGLISAGVGAAVAALYVVTSGGAFDGTDIRTTVILLILIGTVMILALGLSWVSGMLWRSVLRARHTRTAKEQAEQQRAQEQERVRIARDMHDIVAHSLAVVIAQADGARYAAASDPDAARQALATISETSRAALSDVRVLLTQLRHRQGDGPQPTLADLDALFAQVREAGIEPRVTVDPAPASDPPGVVQLAVYRILQEALTNAIRHGEGDAEVHLSWHPDCVELSVQNRVSSKPAAATGGGHGLIGMRERAQLVGGTCDAEKSDEIFTVRATLPMTEAAE